METDEFLTAEQEQRVAALQYAAGMSKVGGFLGTAAPTKWSVEELVALAEYILTGKAREVDDDPYAGVDFLAVEPPDTDEPMDEFGLTGGEHWVFDRDSAYPCSCQVSQDHGYVPLGYRLIPSPALRYAATALWASSDHGDQYTAEQFYRALGEKPPTREEES